MNEATIIVLMDASGDYVVGKDDDAAKEAWENDIGGHWHRRVELTVRIEVPEPIEIEVPAGAVSIKAK